MTTPKKGGGDYLQSIVDRLKAMSPDDRRKIELAAQADSRRWLPNPGAQAMAIKSPADELFFGGVPGPGKSSCLVGCATTEHSKSIIFRREYTQIKGLEDECAKILGSRDGYNQTSHVWKLPGKGNRTLEFGSVPHDHDREKWQGQAHDFIGFDEIAAFLRSQYRYLTLWNRSTVPGQRCRIICAGNPPQTAEGLWIIQHWAPWLDKNHHDPAGPGELRYPVRFGPSDDREHFFHSPEQAIEFMQADWPEEFVPRDDKGRVIAPRSRSFIPGNLSENLDLVRDNAYRAVLAFADAGMQGLVKGEFDANLKDHPQQVIPSDFISAAQNRWTDQIPKGVPMCAMGVDVAQGGGAKTALAWRYDNWFAKPIVVPGAETPRSSDVAALIVKHRRDNCALVVDCSGGYGGPVCEWMELNGGVDCVKYKGGNTSNRRTVCRTHKFYNKRAESWWRFREALDPSQPGGSPICLPPDAQLRADLTAPRFTITPNGILLEDKAEIMKRIGRSPDVGDAFVLAWSEGQDALGRNLSGPGSSRRSIANLQHESVNPNRRYSHHHQQRGSGNRGYSNSTGHRGYGRHQDRQWQPKRNSGEDEMG